MQRKLELKRISDEEQIKSSGLILDFDEIARKGEMSKEEIMIAKSYGIYRSRDPKTHMARVVIPGGKLTSVQARALAKLSKKYSPDRISFTTRQAAQFHCLKLTELSSFLRDLAANNLTTFHGCGDNNRNVAACPWASICQYRRFDVLPYALETAQYINACRDLDNLPRKFKITFSGCGGNCGQPYINCIGAVAVLRENNGVQEPGFKIVMGGGMGWKPFVAQEVYSFVPAKQIARVCRGIAVLFREHGDRYVRKYARLKFVVHRKGIEACRELLNDILDREGVDRSRILTEPIEDAGKEVALRPLRDPDPRDDNGLSIVRIMIPKGEIASDHLALIADLAEKYADKHVYSTNRQNLELHGIKPERVAALKEELKPTGLRTEGFFGLQDVVSCVGRTYCPLAVSTTHNLFDLIQDLISRDKYIPIREKVLINITGCPNSCSPYRIADIGLRGMRVRENSGSSEGYQMTIGGTQQHFGLLLGEFKESDCVRVIEAILDTYLDVCSKTDEYRTLAEHVEKKGIDLYKEAVAALKISYQMVPEPNECSTFTGEGDTTLDFNTIARDIPCQNACPANTNIPEYIRLISEGQYEKAHLINQEDNVLSGTLGRICTRPCEDGCRHQWTNTLGPVRICHLKRSAADYKPEKSKPLPAWYGPTGKKAAIIGGGPAGLAAARELKRYGHEVTIYERLPYVGGQIRTGIPQFRLPREILEEDINAILDSGIEVKLDQGIDNTQLQQLLDDYDAVLIAAGANQPNVLSLDDLPDGIAREGLNFMRAFNDDEELSVGDNVVIIGGGFTAVDCARSARRISPNSNISIMYRRGEAQMAATEDELHELFEEAIRVETLVTPVRAVMENGNLKAVEFRRNILGEPDESGKPRFMPVEGSEFEVPCDTLIVAIGQTQEKNILPEGVTITNCHITSQAGVFVAGDFSMGNGDVINAIGDAKKAADVMDEYLTGKKRQKPVVKIELAEDTGRIRDYDLLASEPMPVIDVNDRDIVAEVETGFTRELAHNHALRCYLCNYKFEIHQDKCIYCDWCIRVSPRDCIRRLSDLQRDENGIVTGYTEVAKTEGDKITYIWIDSDNCIRCGNCYNICPTDAISLRKTDRVNCQE